MRNGRDNNDRAWLPTYGVILLAVAALLIAAALLIPAGDLPPCQLSWLRNNGFRFAERALP